MLKIFLDSFQDNFADFELLTKKTILIAFWVASF